MKNLDLTNIKMELRAFLKSFERDEMPGRPMGFSRFENAKPQPDYLDNTVTFRTLSNADRECSSYVDDGDEKYYEIKELLGDFLSDKPEKKETLFELVEMYLREKHLKPSQVYRKGQMSKQDFSRYVKPDAETINRSLVFNLAIGLMLDVPQTKRLLKSAGFGINMKSRFDLILIFCIDKEIYDVTLINMLLEDFSQPQLKTYYYKEN